MIDVQKVVEAQEVVAQAKTELRKEVKKYLEEHRVFEKKVANDIELEQRLESDQETLEFMLESGLKIFLIFTLHDYSSWDYVITCDELKMYYLGPVTENSLSAQGELTFKYISPEISAERKVKLQRYFS